MQSNTQVGIIGAGPSGLLLAHMLHQQGIASVVIEQRSREDIEATIKAGVLEHPTAELLQQLGVGTRMQREGHVHRGIELSFGGKRHRLDLEDLTGGKSITVYPQHEVIKDLVAAVLANGTPIIFGVSSVQLADFEDFNRINGVNGVKSENTQPTLRYQDGAGADHTLHCDFIAGCDGYHGPARQAIPATLRQEHTRDYPCGWFGILCEAPPSSDELIYAQSDRGFVLVSTRTPTVQRLYFQCDPQDKVSNWPDERIWAEFHSRLANDQGWQLKEGPIFQKGIIAMRSFVCETMQHGRLFLAGDAAHIVPPTGAKGLNLAVGDVVLLNRALGDVYKNDQHGRLESYSRDALQRVWRGEHFSWWMTTMLHDFDGEDPMTRHLRRAQLDYVVKSRAAAQSLAENYVGLPFDGWVA